MEGVKPQAPGGQRSASGDTQPDSPPAESGGTATTAKRRNRKFIDLQKQPPKPKPLVQE